MSRKTDSPGFGQNPGSSYQFYDVPPPGAIFSLDSPTSSASSPCPEKPSTPDPSTPRIQTSRKGVENAKKRLRAFSIQKKTPVTPILPKVATVTSTGSTVLIGRLCSAKVAPKPTIVDAEKLPKPPKPGKCETYCELKKRTLEEIENMKRKMELVELGIPLGLVLPPSNSQKGMPTKAMPPIKSFLDPEKVDQLIREAKKAKAEGKEFKFDYQKFCPGYDNPFQRKPPEKPQEKTEEKFPKKMLGKLKDRFHKGKDRRSDRSRDRRYFEHKKEEKDMHKERAEMDRERSDKDREKGDEKKAREDRREREKDRSKERPKDKESKSEDRPTDKTIKKERDAKETDVNLNDYLVCDSWSLENEASGSPKVTLEESTLKKLAAAKGEIEEAVKDPMEKYMDRLEKKKEEEKRSKLESKQKVEKLQPVQDSFTYEIDPDDEAILDMFDEDSDNMEKFTLPKTAKISMKMKKELDIDSQDSKDSKDSKTSMDFLSEDFLESVIKEIKQENLTDEEVSQDKGLVEYDMSPTKDDSVTYGTPESKLPKSGSTTPEIKIEPSSRCSEYSEGGYKSTECGYKSTESGYKSTESDYKSTESGYKSTESGYKSTESGYKSTERTESVRSDEFDCMVDIEKELDDALKDSMLKVTMDSLETWSFVLKICQPLLFRHDRNKCYRETKVSPKLWFTENPKMCDCVKDRAVVYDELETCKTALVDRVYGCDQVSDYPAPVKRDWYPPSKKCLVESKSIQLSSEWEMEDSSENSQSMSNRVATPKGAGRGAETPAENVVLDREYQRFMAAVYPEVPEANKESGSNTPTAEETSGKKSKKKKKPEGDREEKEAKKMKLSSEQWSLESDAEKVEEKSTKKKLNKDKAKKRKLPATVSDTTDDDEEKKGKKKGVGKKSSKKHKSKEAKRRRLEKKYIKKLKAKQKKKTKKAKEKQEKIEVDSEDEEDEKTKKSKKKKQLKQKKKEQKKKKPKSSSSSEPSSESSSDSDSDLETEKENKTKKKAKKKTEEQRSRKKKEKKKKRKHSTSESTQSDDLFDVNILNNIKTEKSAEENRRTVTDLQDFSPRRQQSQPRQEIINVKELHNDLVTNSIHIKQEVIDNASKEDSVENIEKSGENVATDKFGFDLEKESPPNVEVVTEEKIDVEEKIETKDFKEPQDLAKPLLTLKPVPEESNHSQESQESTSSLKEQSYEKDESHLRPSSQNSNYSFHDVISASQGGWKGEGEAEEGELNNYEMYERMAMEYQSGVANQQTTAPSSGDNSATCRIETVVSRGSRGEIKSDWRPGDTVPQTHRPSRWGLKPGDANIVLTGSGSGAARDPRVFPIRSVLEQDKVYAIESIASRGNDSGGGYDEAYADMYAASDRLQYGDCFTDCTEPSPAARRSLDDRIEAVLGQSAKDSEKTDSTDKGMPAAKEAPPPRAVKRVSFADGYKPGQDSDTEEPPIKKRKKRRLGCPWPCPATHPDHVPLWDALPPPPPPPGSPPPPVVAPPLMLPRNLGHRMDQLILPSLHHHLQKFDPSSIPGLLGPDGPAAMLGLPRMPM